MTTNCPDNLVMANAHTIQQDFEFCSDLGTDAAVLRTVASLNQQMSKKEFLEAAVAAGYPRHAAMARFGESRRLDMECGETYDAEWRNLNP